MDRFGRRLRLTLLSALCLSLLALGACAARPDKAALPEKAPEPSPTSPDEPDGGNEDDPDELLRVTISFRTPEGESADEQQERMIGEIEALLGRELDVKRRFTRAMSAISANVTRRETELIRTLEDVKDVTVETLNELHGAPSVTVSRPDLADA